MPRHLGRAESLAGSITTMADVLLQLAATVLLVAAASIFFFLTRRSAKRAIREAEQPAILCAGDACIGGDVLGRLVQFCHPTAQLTLAGVARGWYHTVRIGTCSLTSVQAREEAAALVFLAEQNWEDLLAADELKLAVRNLGANEGKGLALVLDWSPALRTLRLRGNQLGDDGVAHIAAALRRNPPLSSLELDLNELSDSGVKELARSLEKNRSLTFLNLATNGLGAEVHEDHSDEPSVGDEGAAALATCLEVNEALRTLWLASCELTDAGAGILAASLSRNSTLTSLDLRCNHLSDATKEALLELAARRGGTLSIRV